MTFPSGCSNFPTIPLDKYVNYGYKNYADTQDSYDFATIQSMCKAQYSGYILKLEDQEELNFLERLARKFEHCILQPLQM